MTDLDQSQRESIMEALERMAKLDAALDRLAEEWGPDFFTPEAVEAIDEVVQLHRKGRP